MTIIGNHTRQDSMEPSDLWDDVSNCRCGDRLITLEQRTDRLHQRCLAHSLVGTPNYIAPEVLLRKGIMQIFTRGTKHMQSERSHNPDNKSIKVFLNK